MVTQAFTDWLPGPSDLRPIRKLPWRGADGNADRIQPLDERLAINATYDIHKRLSVAESELQRLTKRFARGRCQWDRESE